MRAACARGIDQALRHRAGRPAFATPLWLLPLRDILSVIEIGASFWVCVARLSRALNDENSASRAALQPDSYPDHDKKYSDWL
jgi:hypothetical protein